MLFQVNPLPAFVCTRTNKRKLFAIFQTHVLLIFASCIYFNIYTSTQILSPNVEVEPLLRNNLVAELWRLLVSYQIK